jgi:hypothetical protein
LVVGGSEEMVGVVGINTAESGNEIAGVCFAAANTAGFEKMGVDADLHGVIGNS